MMIFFYNVYKENKPYLTENQLLINSMYESLKSKRVPNELKSQRDNGSRKYWFSKNPYYV